MNHRSASVVFALAFVAALAPAIVPTPAAAQGRHAAPDWVDPRSDLLAPDVIVYYFHNTFRCLTCLTMENLAEETVRDDFAAGLQSGLVVWRAVDMQLPEQTHFAARYGLDGPALVLSEWREAEEVRWTNLDRIWELVDDPVEYRQYVRTGLQRFLDGESGGGRETPE